jgi:hypothetical protein
MSGVARSASVGEFTGGAPGPGSAQVNPEQLDPQESVRRGHRLALAGRAREARESWLDAAFQFMQLREWAKASATCRRVLLRWPRDPHPERLLRAIAHARALPVEEPVAPSVPARLAPRSFEPIELGCSEDEPIDLVLEGLCAEPG